MEITKPRLVWIAINPFNPDDVEFSAYQKTYGQLFISAETGEERYIDFKPYILTPVDVD